MAYPLDLKELHSASRCDMLIPQNACSIVGCWAFGLLIKDKETPTVTISPTRPLRPVPRPVCKQIEDAASAPFLIPLNHLINIF